MTPSWVNAEVVLRAASALKQFFWQGAAIAAVYALADALLARSAPRVRYAAACAALAAMLAAPIYTFASAGKRPEPPASGATLVVHATSAASPRPAPRPSPPERFDSLAAWLVAGWAAGVAALSARLAAACLAVERLRRRRSVPAGAALEARLASVAARMRVSRPVRLLETAAVRVPSAVGALRPAILLPAGIASGLTAGQLDALLAHELAHVARRDYLVHLLQALAETLLFFHPAVWWISHRIRVEREHACDDLAVAATGDALVYARALLTLAESRLAPAPRLAVAADGGVLSGRIRRLLAGETPRRPLVGAALALSSALALGAAARTPEPSPIPAGPTGIAAQETSPAPTPAPSKPVQPATPSRAARPAKPVAAADSADGAAPGRSAGLLTPDQLVAFRIHGVTPEFIASIRAEGFARATPDELVALRIHGVTAEYIHAMTETLGRQPLEDYAAFKIHGLTPETVRELRQSFGSLSADDALAMRIHGATPEFAREIRAAGYTDLTADEAVAFRIHGVTPEFAREMRGLGLGSVTADDLVAFRIHGVTPDVVRAFRALGLSNLGGDDLVAFRIHGVTPELVKAVRGLGYETITPDDLVAFRIHGVTPEWIRHVNARAGELLSADDLIERRIHGDDEYQEDLR